MKSALAIAAVVACTLLLIGRPTDIEPCRAADLQIDLIPEFDAFGPQIETIQVYQVSPTKGYMAGGIYDTGASVVTFSAMDQMLFDLTDPPGIPIKVTGGAEAQGIGGTLIGDVSQPGTILADGLHAMPADLLSGSYDLTNAVEVPGVQVYVGTSSGSSSLPTITGTPIHNPNPANVTNPNGMSARIDMQGYELDLDALFSGWGFDGIVLHMPDLHFVAPGSTIAPDASTTAVARIPLAMFGEDNHAAPGDMVTAGYNPVVDGSVALGEAAATVSGQTFLFDTGAQLSIMSTDIATQLGFDPNSPEFTIDVQGAAGSIGSIPGFTVDLLELPRDDDVDGTRDGTLRFTSVPIYVLDFGVPGLDGILGMNLFNMASNMLYDPFDADGAGPDGPSLSVDFVIDPDRGLEQAQEDALLAILGDPTSEALFGTFLAGAYPGLTGTSVNLPGYGVSGAGNVPEPTTVALLALAGLCLMSGRTRRRR